MMVAAIVAGISGGMRPRVEGGGIERGGGDGEGRKI